MHFASGKGLTKSIEKWSLFLYLHSKRLKSSGIERGLEKKNTHPTRKQNPVLRQKLEMGTEVCERRVCAAQDDGPLPGETLQARAKSALAERSKLPWSRCTHSLCLRALPCPSSDPDSTTCALHPWCPVGEESVHPRDSSAWRKLTSTTASNVLDALNSKDERTEGGNLNT